MQLFSIMSSSDNMFEASSVHFQFVNERAAHVKIDSVLVLTWAVVNLLFLLLSDGFRLLWGFKNENKKALGVKRLFFSIFVKFSFQDLKGDL